MFIYQNYLCMYLISMSKMCIIIFMRVNRQDVSNFNYSLNDNKQQRSVAFRDAKKRKRARRTYRREDLYVNVRHQIELKII